MSSTFDVAEGPCNQCLLTADRIVPGDRAAEVIRECQAHDRHFICHKASLAGTEIACRGFYDRYPSVGQLRRIAERLGVVRFVPLPDVGEELRPWRSLGVKPGDRR